MFEYDARHERRGRPQASAAGVAAISAVYRLFDEGKLAIDHLSLVQFMTVENYEEPRRRVRPKRSQS